MGGIPSRGEWIARRAAVGRASTPGGSSGPGGREGPSETRLAIWTIGHGARSLADLLRLLRAHRIAFLADVRRFPRSRRHPQFSEETLAAALAAAGLGYRHLPGLGGRREPDGSPTNAGLQVAAFRGYADHMRTETFRRELESLVALARAGPTAMMCAEALPEHCHRSLIGDALLGRGLEVLHILSPGAPRRHELAPAARIVGEDLTYPRRGFAPATGRRGR